ncbi:MAG: glycosyltransferase family 9 protein [Bacteroidota bacterium]
MKILIVQIGRIGDMILTTPMFGALKERFPGSELHVLTSPKGFPVIRMNPHLSKIILHRKGIAGMLGTVLTVRKERYDVWIDPKDHGSSESSFLARYSGAKEKIGFNKAGKHVFTAAVPSEQENYSLHAVERNLLSLASLGCAVNNARRPELFVSAEVEIRTASIVQGKRKIAVVNISAGQATRRWSTEGWSRVIERCLQRNFDVAVAFQPADERQAREFKQRFPDIIVADSPSIEYAVALVKRASLVVSVDTSIVHIASAFDIPIVALYPDVEWNLNKFKPLSTRQSVIVSSSPVSLLDISPDAVLSRIDGLTAQ